MSLSRKEMMAEIVRCGKDPVYFSNKYAKISHPMHGLIPFDMYNFQENALKDFKKHRFNIILKARQLGISTTVASYVAWLMLFHRDKNILVVATKLLYSSAAFFFVATSASGLFKVDKSILRLLSLILSTLLIGPSTLSFLGNKPNLDKLCVENFV